MLKLHLHTMLLSTAYNDKTTVFANLYHGFEDIAERCMHYMDSLTKAKRPLPNLVISECYERNMAYLGLMSMRRDGG